MQQKRAPKPRTRAGAKIDYIQVGRAGLQDAALGKLFRPAVAQNPSMSMPVVGQLYFLAKRDAWPLACLSDWAVAGQTMAPLRLPRRRRPSAGELLHY